MFPLGIEDLEYQACQVFLPISVASSSQPNLPLSLVSSLMMDLSLVEMFSNLFGNFPTFGNLLVILELLQP